MEIRERREGKEQRKKAHQKWRKVEYCQFKAERRHNFPDRNQLSTQKEGAKQERLWWHLDRLEWHQNWTPDNWTSFLQNCFESQKRAKGKDRGLHQANEKGWFKGGCHGSGRVSLTSLLEKGSAWGGLPAWPLSTSLVAVCSGIWLRDDGSTTVIEGWSRMAF